MGKHTQPIFFVGSGRSGTRSIYKMLSGVENVEIYHEYLCTHIQPIAALYSMGRISLKEAAAHFLQLHGSAIQYSDCAVWIDCSNKLSWLIEPILLVFPQSKFVLIVRDGRKVTSSFYHKLSDEMYDDRSVAVLDAWLKEPMRVPMPPPEKKYWWKIPQTGQDFHEDFPRFDQFERCCYHWRQANLNVLESFKNLSPVQHATFKLEELTADKSRLKALLEFTGVPYDERYFELLQKPQNVIFPMDFKLSLKEQDSFNRIAGDLQNQLGYASCAEYGMKY